VDTNDDDQKSSIMASDDWEKQCLSIQTQGLSLFKEGVIVADMHPSVNRLTSPDATHHGCVTVLDCVEIFLVRVAVSVSLSLVLSQR